MENIVVRIDDLARGGAGVGKLSDGRVAFVPWTAPGDLVSIKITKKEKNYVQAEVLEWVEKSPHRVEPRCPVFTKCGGCDWQHIDYETQWKTKTSGVQQALKRANIDVAGLTPELFPATKIWNYRNRIQLRGEAGTLAFFQKNSTNQVEIDRCDIADERINKAIPALKAEAKEKFNRSYKLEVSVSASDSKVQTAWNQKHSALGFEQVHEEQNTKLRTFIASNLPEIADQTLLDLYGGIGNLSENLTASAKHTHVVDFGAKATNTDQTTFWDESVLFWLKNGAKKQIPDQTPCAVIVDPPREGLGNDFEEISKGLDRLSVQTLVHVGCDPDSFARDVSRWIRCGFDIQKLGYFDMFPQTIHVECVAVLSRRT